MTTSISEALISFTDGVTSIEPRDQIKGLSESALKSLTLLAIHVPDMREEITKTLCAALFHVNYYYAGYRPDEELTEIAHHDKGVIAKIILPAIHRALLGYSHPCDVDKVTCTALNFLTENSDLIDLKASADVLRAIQQKNKNLRDSDKDPLQKNINNFVAANPALVPVIFCAKTPAEVFQAFTAHAGLDEREQQIIASVWRSKSKQSDIIAEKLAIDGDTVIQSFNEAVVKLRHAGLERISGVVTTSTENGTNAEPPVLQLKLTR